MENQVILRVRFPNEDTGAGDIIERISKFESFFYSVFYLLVRQNESVSFEIVAAKGTIKFYIVLSLTLLEPLNALLFARFPDTEIVTVTQYDNFDDLPSNAAGFIASLMGNKAYTLRTAQAIKGDPLNSFFNTLSEVPQTDALLYQLVISPVDESIDEGPGGGLWGSTEKQEIVETKPKFKTTIRLLYLGQNLKDNLKSHSSAIEKSFSSFATDQNYLKVDLLPDTQAAVDDFSARTITGTTIFNTEEIAGLFHCPDPAAKIRGIDWLFSRKAEPPMNVPTLENSDPNEISIFGVTDFRGKQLTFGLRREDRRRHLYIAGKSGVGKSKLLEKLISDDIKAHKGVCVIDPHGDLIQSLFYHIPADRVNDVVYFNPGDLAYPIAFNPLENVAREFKQQVTQGMIEIFKKFFAADWTPKIEHVFRFTILALLDFKKATFMGMQKMLTDRGYRQMVIADIQDHVVKKFWANEFSSWSEKFDNEAIVPLINKLGQFLSNEMVRNIVAQPINKVDFNDIMNNERILLVELAKGKLGEENSSLLGSLLITKIEQQGMARAFIAQKERKDFYLYVDEFQNFATKTFDNIFSEARKYRLNLTVSHQYLGQLTDPARETIFGNVGSMITFRMGADDAKYIAQELAPRFSANDIMNLGVREMYLKLSINGGLTPAFSATTVNVPEPEYNQALVDKIIATSRSKYATPVAEVEKTIEELYENFAGTEAAATAEAGEQKFDEPMV